MALIVFFALPFIIAKAILSNHWYESGVTNHGSLVEPRVTFESLDLVNPLQTKSWQLGFMLPTDCNDACINRLYIMGQTYLALGKYKERVTPVVYVLPDQVLPELPESLSVVTVNAAFTDVVPEQGYLIADTLGQLVMYFTPTSEDKQVAHSKGLLSDLRKLLKLSRVG
ncbi:hypotehtical protein in cytochrome oxidase biogenesis cluster [Vibrio maritimus]|uniref:Hypotehtical protein in cytochrome oxidase biogenesis cluster n=1 Tax=Vibrio maritimus TaxID=990268 RepID=A0A090TDA8_9VIBR|nr:hypotehtical protein in cytochrome oxidase biogenesis cluster [Vibrio maritimus]